MKKGFTLIELLIVIGIIAVLATAVLLVLNPAQILAETRDTQRFSDLNTLKKALALFLTTTATPNMDFTIFGNTCASDFWAMVASVISPFTIGSQAASVARTVSGNGWVPVQLDGMTDGSPLSVLPVDPVNTASYFYGYACDNAQKTFELNANLESSKYTTGATNKETNAADGGNKNDFYETGTDPGLDL